MNGVLAITFRHSVSPKTFKWNMSMSERPSIGLGRSTYGEAYVYKVKHIYK